MEIPAVGLCGTVDARTMYLAARHQALEFTKHIASQFTLQVPVMNSASIARLRGLSRTFGGRMYLTRVMCDVERVVAEEEVRSFVCMHYCEQAIFIIKLVSFSSVGELDLVGEVY
jgi:hypothetical protein